MFRCCPYLYRFSGGQLLKIKLKSVSTFRSSPAVARVFCEDSTGLTLATLSSSRPSTHKFHGAGSSPYFVLGDLRCCCDLTQGRKDQTKFSSFAGCLSLGRYGWTFASSGSNFDSNHLVSWLRHFERFEAQHHLCYRWSEETPSLLAADSEILT